MLSWVYGIGNLRDCDCVLGTSGMTTFKENVVYEVEMIGGGLLVIVSGLWLWKRSGLKNKTFEIE